MKKKIPYEIFLFSSFMATNIANDLLDGKKINSSYSISEEIKELMPYVPKISELLFSIVWLHEDDPGLSSITPQSLGAIEKYGCKNAQDFLRHLRNSISHNHCEFYDDGSALFWDIKKSGIENFRIELDSQSFSEMIEEFRVIAYNEFFPMLNNNKIVTSIRLGNNISLGAYSFCGCVNLESVLIPANINEIPEWSFCNCKKLKCVILPNEITHIKKRAFSGCENIENIVNNPLNLKVLGDYAFAHCTKIQHITINANTKVGKCVFKGWGKNQKIYIKDSSNFPTHWDKKWKDGCKATIEFK